MQTPAERRFALGTAQFGSKYGINNAVGQTSRDAVAKLLHSCARHGVRSLDTAVAYGSSESIIGEVCTAESLSFEVISKLPACEPSEVEAVFSASQARLKSTKLRTYLIHDFDHFQGHPQLWNELQRLKAAGRLAKIGFSLYHPWQVEWLQQHGMVPDVVQAPYNVFDQRFERVFPLLKSLGAEIHARSVFLQGLFFMPPARLPLRFETVRHKLMELRRISEESGVPMYAALLNFVCLDPRIDLVVFGVDTLLNLEENLTSGQWLEASRALQPRLAQLAESDEEIILPRKWK